MSDSEIVTIPDDSLRSALLKQADLTKEKLEAVTELDLTDNNNVKDLTGLEHCSGLRTRP